MRAFIALILASVAAPALAAPDLAMVARITDEGVVVIKAQQFRTQEKNKTDAFERLKSFSPPQHDRNRHL